MHIDIACQHDTHNKHHNYAQQQISLIKTKNIVVSTFEMRKVNSRNKR